MSTPQSNDPVSPWIEAARSVPAYADEVLLATNSGDVVIGCRSHTDNKGEHWRGMYRVDMNSNEVYGVTHWMPLPAHPSALEKAP